MNIDISQKRYLIDLTNAQGWILVSKLAEDKLTSMEKAALSHDGPDAEIAALVRQVQGSRVFWESLLQTIENSKNPAVDSSAFAEVSY